MIEAELKARLDDPATIRATLDERATAEHATYRDTYYDTRDEQLDTTDRELRLRTIEIDDHIRHLLTFKDAAVDQASRSKPEYETTVAAPAAVVRAFEALGCTPLAELTKLCENYRFAEGDRDFTATIVRVPEIQGTFLEVETMAEEDDVADALDAVRAVLKSLGVRDDELTTELYTAAVRRERGSQQ